MNDFIEVLRSVGGVTPCINGGENEKPWHKDDQGRTACVVCHGAGRVINLALLLAKPKELEECVKELWTKLSCQHVAEVVTDRVLACQMKVQPTSTTTVFPGDRYIVGPQRAHSLVYEVSRQLGGTAVVCKDFKEYIPSTMKLSEPYRLSIPVPDNAMVLFVMDKFGANNLEEFKATINTVEHGRAIHILPYILCLVSTEFKNETIYKVISLHQEKA